MSISEAGTHANNYGIRSARKNGNDYYEPLLKKRGNKTKEATLRKVKKREALVDTLMRLIK